MAAKVLFLALALFCAASAAPESRDARIVGGSPVPIQQAPYAAALVYFYPGIGRYIQRCNGAIVSSWHVITTSFCFLRADLQNFRVRVGSSYSLSGGSVVNIQEYIEHPDYTMDPRSNDLAVALLSEPLRISSSVDILYLPPQNYNIPDGTNINVVSWGFESEQGPQHEALKEINLNTVPLEQCQAAFADVEDVTVEDSALCAAQSGYGTCFGDSGAPAVIRSYQNILVGIASVYHECGTDTYPDVFTRVDRFTNWIMEVARPPTRSAADVDAPIVAEY